MARFSFMLLALVAMLGFAAAFVPPARLVQRPQQARALTVVKEAPKSSYWEGEYPPSEVLGPFLSKVPSGVLGPLSLVCLVAGTYAAHESNILNGGLSLEKINPLYVGLTFLAPISWGLHVAAWIQKKNGK